MANSLKGSSGKKAFCQFSEPQNAGDYILNKKAQATYCVANKCIPSVKVGSQGNLLLFNTSNKLTLYPCKNTIDRANLYINLITKIDLSGNIPVIEDFYSKEVPSTVDTTVIPYLAYNIDPSGTLFGNTICGAYNYTNYMVYNPPYQTTNPGHIDTL